MLVLASAALIAAAVPVSLTKPLSLSLIVTPLVAATVMLPCDTASVVVSVSPVFGVSVTDTWGFGGFWGRGSGWVVWGVVCSRVGGRGGGWARS